MRLTVGQVRAGRGGGVQRAEKSRIGSTLLGWGEGGFGARLYHTPPFVVLRTESCCGGGGRLSNRMRRRKKRCCGKTTRPRENFQRSSSAAACITPRSIWQPRNVKTFTCSVENGISNYTNTRGGVGVEKKDATRENKNSDEEEMWWRWWRRWRRKDEIAVLIKFSDFDVTRVRRRF